MIKTKKVLVAMSGGVDSSVAAALLKEQGYEVVGATMQVWDYSQCDIDEGNGTCCSSTDVDDARAVCDVLGIPFYVLNCETKFKEAVIDPFVKSYLQGQTPLPCVNCNTYLKFDHLIQKMKELDCDYLATGHYAQIQLTASGKYSISTSVDDWKDQTYFLFTIDPEIVPKLLFPIGHLNKPEVRKIALEKCLPVASKKDSTGICFVGNKGYGNFIEEQVGKENLRYQKGNFRRFPNGELMGEHEGIHHFTIGQSRGFGLTHHEKMYVVKIDAETKTVWLGDEKYLFQKTVETINAKTLLDVEDGESVLVKIRYHHKPSPARIWKTEKGFRFEFEEPQKSVTTGQAAVFYRGKDLVGGAWIIN